MKNIEEQFDESFLDPACLADNCKNPQIIGTANDIKQFYSSKISKLLGELPKRKCKLRNVLQGTEDEVFESNGIDGVSGWNKCVSEIEKIIKSSEFKELI